MKKLLNTLYATTEGASLRKDGENVVAEGRRERGRVPCNVGGVVVFGGILFRGRESARGAGRITLVRLIAGPVRGAFEGRSAAMCCCAHQISASKPPDGSCEFVTAKIATSARCCQARACAIRRGDGRTVGELTRGRFLDADLGARNMKEGAEACAVRGARGAVISGCSAILSRPMRHRFNGAAGAAWIPSMRVSFI